MITRRQLMSGLVPGNIVIGFDKQDRKWVTSAETTGFLFDSTPPLDGVLTMDDAIRNSDSRDQGNIVINPPSAVLRPGSVADVQKMVAFCRALDIKVSARGAAHTTFGQGLANGGLVIEMQWLNKIYSIEPSGADVAAGALWRDLAAQAASQGLRAASGFTAYLGLTLGGTLSVGGVSPNYREGGQVDRVQQVEVVTGKGEVFLCSLTTHSDLFNAALGGLGQCGIITRARIDMLPAPSRVRTYVLSYTDNVRMFRDLRLLRDRGEADGLFCEWQPTESGVQQQLYVDVYYEPAFAPEDTFLLRGTSARPVVTDLTYLEYVQYFDSVIESYRLAGYDSYVKPWFDVWLPDSSVEAYVGEIVSTLKQDDWSRTSSALLYVHRRAAMTRPCFRVPDRTDWVYLFDILNDSGTPGPNPAFLERMLTRNDTFWTKAKLLGGTRYPIGALRFTNEDWVEHYGPTWSAFRDWKRRFDPEQILTPGPGIFS